MIASHAENGASPRPLEVLGIDADEERVYRFLLTSGEATLEEVTRGLGLPARKTQRLLDAIGAKGLTTLARTATSLYSGLAEYRNPGTRSSTPAGCAARPRDDP